MLHLEQAQRHQMWHSIGRMYIETAVMRCTAQNNNHDEDFTGDSYYTVLHTNETQKEFGSFYGSYICRFRSRRTFNLTIWKNDMNSSQIVLLSNMQIKFKELRQIFIKKKNYHKTNKLIFIQCYFYLYSQCVSADIIIL